MMHSLLFALVLGASPAAAEGGDTSTSEPDAPQLESIDSVSGQATEALKGDVLLGDQSGFEQELTTRKGRQYEPIVYLGAEQLGTDPAFVHGARQGLRLVFERDYTTAKTHFEQMGVRHRGTGIGPIGQVLIWQAMMLENFDFEFDSQYKTAYRRAKVELEEALLMPGNDAWENFIMGGLMGIDAIYAMRQEKYVRALGKAYDALKFVNRSQELAPDFIDAKMGDALFDYWAPVISRTTLLIPDLPDTRASGIRQLLLVQSQGIFLQAPASLALTFTWVEEGKKTKALASALRNREAYPNNVINNLVLGRVYRYHRKYRDSETVLKEVLSLSPDNRRGHFYLARTYLWWNRLEPALTHMDTFLGFDEVDKMQRGWAQYYRGRILTRLDREPEAMLAYKRAWKLARIKRAKLRYEKLKERA
jgi:tetratricopeptide (TPR) repeat protein